MGEADIHPITRGKGGGWGLQSRQRSPCNPSPTHQDPREAQELRMEAWEEVEVYDLGRGLHWCSMNGQALPRWGHQSTWNEPSLQLQVEQAGGARERTRGPPGEKRECARREWGGGCRDHSLRPMRAACQNQLCKDLCPRLLRGCSVHIYQGNELVPFRKRHNSNG